MRIDRHFLLVAIAISSNSWASDWAYYTGISYGLAEGLIDRGRGVEGMHCVKTTAKVGDIISGPGDSRWVVRSLSGTATRCPNEFPIRSRLEGHYSDAEQKALQTTCVSRGAKIGDRYHERGVGQVVVREVAEFGTSCPDERTPKEARVLPVASIQPQTTTPRSVNATVASPPAPPMNKVADAPKSVADRLRDLKSLHDQGLVTKEIYEEKQRDILKSQ